MLSAVQVVCLPHEETLHKLNASIMDGKLPTELQDNKRKVILCHYPIMCYNGQYRLDGNGNPKVYMLYGHVHDTYDQRLIEQFQEITRSSIRENPDGKRWREQEYEQQSLFLT